MTSSNASNENETGTETETGNRTRNGNGDGNQSVDDGDVVVPMSLYKVVTVFSTLLAAIAVVGGFFLLDRATGQATVAVEEVNVVLAILGVASILLGSGIYVFSTRFRTEGMGMGNAKDDAD